MRKVHVIIFQEKQVMQKVLSFLIGYLEQVNDDCERQEQKKPCD